jgi:hypothetical protein
MDLRAHIRAQLDLQPTAADYLEIATRLKDMVAARNDPTLIPCWLCGERFKECGREDCDRRWRLKDAPRVHGDGTSTIYPEAKRR